MTGQGLYSAASRPPVPPVCVRAASEQGSRRARRTDGQDGPGRRLPRRRTSGPSGVAAGTGRPAGRALRPWSGWPCTSRSRSGTGRTGTSTRRTVPSCRAARPSGRSGQSTWQARAARPAVGRRRCLRLGPSCRGRRGRRRDTAGPGSRCISAEPRGIGPPGARDRAIVSTGPGMLPGRASLPGRRPRVPLPAPTQHHDPRGRGSPAVTATTSCPARSGRSQFRRPRPADRGHSGPRAC